MTNNIFSLAATVVLLSCTTGEHMDFCANPHEDDVFYVAAMCAGEQAIAEGKILDAIEHFESAASLELAERPNYEPFIRLAALHCMAGNLAVGRQLVDDGKCMLDIDEGLAQCYLPYDRISSDPKLVKADAMTDLCFSKMCGEIYLPYYGDKHSRDRISVLRTELEKTKMICGYIEPR